MAITMAKSRNGSEMAGDALRMAAVVRSLGFLRSLEIAGSELRMFCCT
jgi:hypothetical protein